MTVLVFFERLDLNEWASLATISSLVVAIVAFPLVWWQLRSSSAANGFAALSFIQTTFTDVASDIKNKRGDIEDNIERLLNVMEISCALLFDRAFQGSTKIVVIHTINSGLEIMNSSEVILDAIAKTISSPTDYSMLRSYVSERDDLRELRRVLAFQTERGVTKRAYKPWVT